jgi:hypothetical protein
MNINQIQNKFNLSEHSLSVVGKLLSKHGQFAKITYQRPLKFKKDFLHFTGFKRTTGNFRLGINYSNIHSVKVARSLGQPIGELKGKSWVIPNYILEGKNGLLARIYTINNSQTNVEYFLNGKKLTVGELEKLTEICLASEFNERQNLESFDLGLENIIEIK